MLIRYAVIKRNPSNGLLISCLGTFDTIEDAEEHKEHCEDTSGRISQCYYTVDIVFS